jgi:hypothetical protein
MSNGTSQASIATPSTPVPHGHPEAVVANRKRPAEAEETPEQRRKRIKKQELADARDKIKRLEEANAAITSPPERRTSRDERSTVGLHEAVPAPWSC